MNSPKVPPVVRLGLARDYKEHYTRYIAGKFKAVALVNVTPRLLEEFRAYLLNERGLSLKSSPNIIDASFRIMLRDARKFACLIDRDPFEALSWPRVHNLPADPFTESERDKVIAQFTKKSPFYVPFVLHPAQYRNEAQRGLGVALGRPGPCPRVYLNQQEPLHQR